MGLLSLKFASTAAVRGDRPIDCSELVYVGNGSNATFRFSIVDRGGFSEGDSATFTLSGGFSGSPGSFVVDSAGGSYVQKDVTDVRDAECRVISEVTGTGYSAKIQIYSQYGGSYFRKNKRVVVADGVTEMTAFAWSGDSSGVNWVESGAEIVGCRDVSLLNPYLFENVDMAAIRFGNGDCFQNVVELGNYAFYRALNVRECPLRIGGVEKFGMNCFYGATGLPETVVIGENVKSVGNTAFNGTDVRKMVVRSSGSLSPGCFSSVSMKEFVYDLPAPEFLPTVFSKVAFGSVGTVFDGCVFRFEHVTSDQLRSLTTTSGGTKLAFPFGVSLESTGSYFVCSDCELWPDGTIKTE